MKKNSLIIVLICCLCFLLTGCEENTTNNNIRYINADDANAPIVYMTRNSYDQIETKTIYYPGTQTTINYVYSYDKNIHNTTSVLVDVTVTEITPNGSKVLKETTYE